MDESTARATLEQLLADLDRSLEVMGTSGGADTGELTLVDQHPADAATDIVDADREEASIEVLTAQRERVTAALERLDNGTYGRCVDCGRELPDERLEARPEAERCVDDQAKAEAGR